MKKYVVAYIDFFDNQLQIMITEAENKIQALYNGYDYFVGNYLRPNISSVEDFKQEMLNEDSMMEALEI